ncbi:MAG: glycosyltransferase family 39 protein [Chloroflexi bacterium]|nr:glycosyltransferase family 39 protein [Chloroflexota bacterium]
MDPVNDHRALRLPPIHPRSSRGRGGLLAIGLIAPLAAGFLAWRGSFDGLYGQDPYAYYDYAIGTLRGWLSAGPSLNLPFFYWPPGYPALILLAAQGIGLSPLAGQVVSLCAGGLAAVFTGLLARELDRDDRRVPLLAALMVAFSGQLWQSAMVVMPDTAALAAATGGVWALARYARRNSLRWLLLAAGALAWAVITRWVYALVAIPCALYALVVLSRQPRRVALAHGLAAAIWVAVMLGPVVVPTVSAILKPGGGPIPFGADFEVYTWNPLNALRSEFVNADGHLVYRLPTGLYYTLAPAREYYFTPLLALFILPGLWVVARRRSLGSRLLVVGWAAIVYVFLIGAQWQNFRFTLSFMPPLAILAAIGLERTTGAIGRIPQRGLMGSLVVVSLLWMAFSGASLAQGFIERKDADLEVVRWAESRTPPDARLLAFSITLTFQHYSRLETRELYTLDPAQLAALTVERRPTFLLINVENVEQQWAGRSPSENTRWLRDGPGLAALGQFRDYTLFRVGSP